MDSSFIDLSSADGELTPRVVSGLYIEAMVLADEVRAYFDEVGREERDALLPLERVSFSCESLKVTTRLMHVIAWLLTQRAVEAGEIDPFEARQSTRRLGEAAHSDAAVIADLPARARQLVTASVDLYARVQRLDAGMAPAAVAGSPARDLFHRLAAAF